MTEPNLTAAAASAIQQQQVANQVAVAVAQKTLAAQKQQGTALVNLVQQSEQLAGQLAQGRIDVEV